MSDSSDLLDSMAENGQFRSDPRATRQDHHIWCNFFTRPLEGCPQCPGLWEKYPYDENNFDELALAAQHFPDAVPRR